MSQSSVGAVTGLLRSIQNGTPGATGELISLIYGELHRLAQKQMANVPAKHTLQPTALVNEAYLRLFKETEPTWENRHHFFWAAARAMHDILVERARKRAAVKRGGDRKQIELHEDAAIYEQSDELLAITDAMGELKKEHSRAWNVVMLKYFGGLTFEQTAELLGISEATARRAWDMARAWLHKRLN